MIPTNENRLANNTLNTKNNNNNNNSFENDFGVLSIDDHGLTNQNKKKQSNFSSFSSSSSNSSCNHRHITQNKLRQHQCDSNDVAPKVKLLLSNQSHQKSNHMRMIVCGDSGIGKSALVHALSTASSSAVTEQPQSQQQQRNDSPPQPPSTPSTPSPTLTPPTSLEPIEVFVPETDTCIVDTSGYGALLRAEVIFSNVKSYIETQFEKTNTLFNNSQHDEDGRMTNIVYRSTDILTHVDACLYLIMGRLKPVDIEYMRTIHDLVNIIPVIIQPDLSLRPEIRIEQRLEILTTMESNSIKFSLLGYENYQDLIRACKEPSKHPQCPPFMLDWSITKHKRSFHGLLPLKQAIYQHQSKYLHYTTTEKFISWRNSQHPSINNATALTSSSTTLSTLSSPYTTTTSSSSQEQLKNMNNIRISQYVSKRRHSMEREMLIQEKKLRQEFELATKQRRTELILKELNALVKGTTSDNNQKEAAVLPKDLLLINNKNLPMTHSPFWILLSILLSIFICYQNRNLIY